MSAGEVQVGQWQGWISQRKVWSQGGTEGLRQLSSLLGKLGTRKGSWMSSGLLVSWNPVPQLERRARSLQCRSLFWPRVLWLPPSLLLSLPSPLKSTQQTPCSRAEQTCSPRGEGVVGTLQSALPALAWGGALAQERAGCGGLFPSHPHSSTSHLPWGPIWARENSVGAA